MGSTSVRSVRSTENTALSAGDECVRASDLRPLVTAMLSLGDDDLRIRLDVDGDVVVRLPVRDKGVGASLPACSRPSGSTP